jgi:tryptophan synthase beta chain
MERRRFSLPDTKIPRAWYNIQADLAEPVPPLRHPVTKQPATPEDVSPLFPMSLIMQEVSRERYVEIPEPVREIYALWRPTPLMRARRLEQVLQTPAQIYYKYEGASPAGSHKPNTAVAQAFYNKEAGVEGLTTETGAGQWGSALAMACRFFDLSCKVFMVKVSYHQKPYRRSLMQTWGAEVTPSPSCETQAGRQVLAENPDSPGTLGIAISEATEAAATSGGKLKYSLGSVLNHVLMHQTVIGEEALEQMEMVGEAPDVVIGCTGGGSNFAGLAFPFLREKWAGKISPRIVAAEPTACPSLTKGIYTWDYGDGTATGPIAKMHTLGHTFVPPGIHAGGLRYHGMAPIVSLLKERGEIEAVALPQVGVFEAAVQFARAEGIVPAPETAHAVKAAIDEAIRARDEGKKRVILFNFSGHGHFDMGAYDQFFSGTLEGYEYPEEKVKEALGHLPKVEE